MRKAKLNFYVDLVAFVAFVFLTVTGGIIQWVLPPRSGRFTALWGLDRHEWGQVHFWISVILLVSLALHLLLHWKWIIGMTKGQPNKRSRLKTTLAATGVIVLLALSVAPFVSSVEQTGDSPYRIRAEGAGSSTELHITGSMSLQEVAEQTGLPAAVIKKELGLPKRLPTDSRLGRLRRQFSFEIHDVRAIVNEHSQ